MALLALETSTFTASVALLDGERATARERGPEGAHSADLLALIDDVLARSGRARAALGELDGVAVGAGPGSFTGLRIGMATAKGIAFAAGRPLWAVSSLAALALDAAVVAPAGALLVPVLDARRGEVFAGLYRAEGGLVVEVAPERVAGPADLAVAIAEVRAAGGAAAREAVVFGDARALVAPALGGGARWLDAARPTPSAISVARLASAGLGREGLRVAAPAYLRAAAAEVKFPTGSPGGSFTAEK